MNRLILPLLFLPCVIFATPNSLFWTNCTTDVQATGTTNLAVNNFFTIFNKKGHGSSFAPDVGLTQGVFTWKDIRTEAGFDYLGGTDYPFFFNAKAGIEENKLFSNAPSMSIGIFNWGTKSGVTNQNVINLVFGHTLPESIGGTLYIAGYSANRALEKNRQGFMIGYKKELCPTTDCCGMEYHKWVLMADYCSGKNSIGGGGGGFQHFFTPYINIIVGPVWFNDTHINGMWKLLFQVNISFPTY